MKRKSVLQPPYGRPLNRSHPLAQGMIGCWMLDEGGGKKAMDKVYNGFGSIDAATTYQETQKGQACNFTASATTEINIGNLSRYQLPRATTAFWFQATTLPTSGSIKGIIAKRAGNGATTIEWSVGLDNISGTTYLTNNNYNGSSSSVVYNNTPMQANVWYFGCVTWDGTNPVQIYVNMNSATTVSSAPVTPQNQTNNVYIGSWGTNNFPFSGNIKNVMLWNRVLTGDEIAQLYVNPYCILK